MSRIIHNVLRQLVLSLSDCSLVETFRLESFWINFSIYSLYSLTAAC